MLNKKAKNRIPLFLLLIPVFLIPIYLLSTQNSVIATSEEQNIDSPCIGVPSLTSDSFLDEKTALQYGVNGVIVLNLKEKTTSINVVQGQDKQIILIAKFVSYVPEIKETIVRLDPNDLSAIIIEKGLGIGKGTLKLNDMVRYDTMYIRIRAGEEVQIPIIINVPLNTPHVYIPFNPVGLISEYPIINDIVCDINV